MASLSIARLAYVRGDDHMACIVEAQCPFRTSDMVVYGTRHAGRCASMLQTGCKGAADITSVRLGEQGLKEGVGVRSGARCG